MPNHYQGSAAEQQALDTYLKLMRAAETVDSQAHQHLTSAGLTTTQFQTLEALYHIGPLHQNALAEKLLKSNGNISFVIENLVKLGLVARERDLNDRRFVTIRLTDQGEKLIETVFQTHVAIITKQMSILSPSEQEELGRLCRKLGLTIAAGPEQS